MAISPRLAMRTLRNINASSQRNIPMFFRWIAVPFVLQHVEGADQPDTGLFGIDDLIDVPQGGGDIGVGKLLPIFRCLLVAHLLWRRGLLDIAPENDVHRPFWPHDSDLRRGIGQVDVAANMLA